MATISLAIITPIWIEFEEPMGDLAGRQLIRSLPWLVIRSGDSHIRSTHLRVPGFVHSHAPFKRIPPGEWRRAIQKRQVVFESLHWGDRDNLMIAPSQSPGQPLPSDGSSLTRSSFEVGIGCPLLGVSCLQRPGAPSRGTRKAPDNKARRGTASEFGSGDQEAARPATR